LTLEQAVVLAKQNSLKLHVSENELRRSTLAHSELGATALPQVSVKAGASYAPDSRSFGYDPAITDGGQLNGQLAVEQNLYDGGVRRLKSAQLGIDLERLQAEHRLTERDLVAEVKQQFIALLQADRELVLQRQSAGQLQGYFDLVRSMNAGGVVPYTDVLKTQVDLAGAEVAQQKAHAARLGTMLTLESLMGVPADTNLTVRGSLDSLVISYGDSLLRVLPGYPASTLELHNATLDVRRSELDVQIARRERRPLIDLTVDAGYLSSQDNLALPAGERYTGLGFSAGITAALPLYNGGATRIRIQQAEIAAENLRLQRQIVERSLNSQAQTLRLQIQSGLQTLGTLRQTIRTAEQNYLLVRSTYAGGGTTATEVLSAQQMLRDANLADLEAISAIVQLRIQLEQTLTPIGGTQP
jgi:outer membrane protein TolC